VDIKPRKRAAVGAAARYLTTRRNGAAILECTEAAPILSRQHITAPVMDLHHAYGI
jgi:hypothetical protein